MITVYNQRGVTLYGMYFTPTNEMYTFTYNKATEKCEIDTLSIWPIELNELEQTHCLSEIKTYLAQRKHIL